VNLLETFGLLARYNRLANERLYGACAELGETELKRPRPAFFGNIHATLNHIMVGDRIWLARLTGQGAALIALDAILYEEFGDLRAARAIEDARIEAFAAGLDEAALARTLRYRNSAGDPHDDPVPLLVMHLFNHQTHHRGQVHDMLMQTQVAPPSLDMHRVLRPEPVT